MSYANGKIYCEPNVDPKIGVSIGDVQNALGTTEKDIGNLCKHNNIKRWAKFKPVNIGGMANGSTYINTYPLLNPSTMKWNESLSFQWWRDTNKNNIRSRYGLLPAIATNMSDLYNAYADGGDWQYYPPMGGAEYPFRLIDFNQYSTKATEPKGIEIGNWTQNITGSWSFSFDLPSSQNDATHVSLRDYIVPKDILNALWGDGNVYYGLAIFDAANNALMYCATSSTISGTGTNVGTASLSYEHDYYIIPFFANRQISASASLGGATVSTVPNSSMGCMRTSQSGTQEYGRYILKATFGATGRLVVNIAISTETFAGVHYQAHEFKNIELYVCNTTASAPATGSPSSYLYKQEYGNIYLQADTRWDATWDGRPSQTQLICYLYEDGKKRATASAKKAESTEPTLKV